MGYSFDDFFEEHVVPKLVELFKTTPVPSSDLLPSSGTEEPEISDRFLNILRSSIQEQYRGEDFARRLIDVAINPDNEELSPDQSIRKFFNQKYNDEIELRKVEYSVEGSIVNVNYRGEMEEQEFNEKLIERLADKKSGKF